MATAPPLRRLPCRLGGPSPVLGESVKTTGSATIDREVLLFTFFPGMLYDLSIVGPILRLNVAQLVVWAVREVGVDAVSGCFFRPEGAESSIPFRADVAAGTVRVELPQTLLPPLFRLGFLHLRLEGAGAVVRCHAACK